MTSPLSGLSVLVVEDESMILMLVEDLLRDNGCSSVAPAATVESALLLTKNKKFDAAMLDLNLRGESSYRVADALMAHKIPFFFSTGNTVTSIKEAYRSIPVLRKPYNQTDLLDAFSRVTH